MFPVPLQSSLCPISTLFRPAFQQQRIFPTKHVNMSPCLFNTLLESQACVWVRLYYNPGAINGYQEH